MRLVDQLVPDIDVPIEESRTHAQQTLLADAGQRRWASIAATGGRRYGLIVIWGLMIAGFGANSPNVFLTWLNFKTMFSSQAILLMLALALVVSLVSGDFDIAVSGTFSSSLVLIGEFNIVHHIGWGFAALIALAFGLFVGVLHAFLIVYLGLSSFIVTLGTGTALLGTGYAFNSVAVSGVSPSYKSFMSYSVIGLQMPFLIAVVLTVALWYLYGYTPLGRRLYFVGASRDVSRLAGLSVNRLRAGSLIASSLIASLTAIVAAGYIDGADPNLSSSFLLPITAAALLGSTVIWPGRANPGGAFVATYFLVTGYTGLQQIGISSWVQQVFYGGALVVAVAAARLTAAGQGGADPGQLAL